jgi:hypothetical protein
MHNVYRAFPRIFETETNEDIEGEETTQERENETDTNLSIIHSLSKEFNLSYLQVLEMSVIEVFYLFDWVIQKNEKELKEMEQMKNN